MSIGSVFLIHAFVSGSWAPRVPSLKDGLDIGAGELGIALTGLALGLIAGTRLAGRPVDRLGTRRTLRVGLVVQCAALVGLALAPDLRALIGAFGLLGVATGFVDVAMNSNAVAVERRYVRPIMSGLHGLWSVGLLAGAAVGTAAAALGAGTAVHFVVVAVVLAVLAVAATRRLLSTAGESVERQAERDSSSSIGGWSPPVLLLGLIAFSSFAGEGSAADWSAVYLHETIGTGTGSAGVAFVAFSVGMIGSRFAADALSARVGPRLVTRAGGLVAAGGLGVALLLPHDATAVAGFLLFGLGLGPIVPIAFSAAGNLDRARTGVILGSVVTIGYLGTVVGPLVIGFAAEALSLRAALVFPVLLALTIASAAFAVSTAAGGGRRTGGGPRDRSP